MFTKIFIERRVNRLEINLLNLALLSDGFDEEQLRVVARIFYGLRRGWLTVNDLAEEEMRLINNRLRGTLKIKSSSHC